MRAHPDRVRDRSCRQKATLALAPANRDFILVDARADGGHWLCWDKSGERARYSVPEERGVIPDWLAELGVHLAVSDPEGRYARDDGTEDHAVTFAHLRLTDHQAVDVRLRWQFS